MNIASVILRTHPDRLAAVRNALAALSGVDVCADPGDGRLILTVEDTDRAKAADVLLDLHRLEGVLSTTLVYQFSDDALTPASN